VNIEMTKSDQVFQITLSDKQLEVIDKLMRDNKHITRKQFLAFLVDFGLDSVQSLNKIVSEPRPKIIIGKEWTKEETFEAMRKTAERELKKLREEKKQCLSIK
jgi:hypothetical protein